MPRAVCDTCRQRPRGPLSYFYPRLLSGELTYFRRVRLCDAHVPTWVLAVLENLPPEARPDEFDPMGACFGCGQVFSIDYRGDQFYLSVYKNGEAEQHFYGETCPSCSSRIITKGLLKPTD